MPNEHYLMVKEFMVACNKQLPAWFHDAKCRDAELAAVLIEEEHNELMMSKDLSEDQLDALIDLLYVCYNAYLYLGLGPNVNPTAAVPSPFRPLIALASKVRFILMFRRPLCDTLCQSALDNLVNGTYGILNLYCYPVDAAFKAVHAANMSKFWSAAELKQMPEDHNAVEARGQLGKFVVTRPDGKIIKSPSFRPPDLSAFVRQAHARLTSQVSASPSSAGHP